TAEPRTFPYGVRGRHSPRQSGASPAEREVLMIVRSDEQWAIRTELAATLRVFSRRGFEVGSAGHVTVRDPRLEDHYWANPFAIPFALTKASDIVLVNGAGEVVTGEHDSRGFQGHIPVHRQHPEL